MYCTIQARDNESKDFNIVHLRICVSHSMTALPDSKASIPPYTVCVCVCVYLALFAVQYNTIQSHGVSRWFMGPRLADKNNLTQSLWTTVSHFATKHHGIPISQTLHSTIFAFRVGNKGKTFTLG